jgi:hypothetical protein
MYSKTIIEAKIEGVTEVTVRRERWRKQLVDHSEVMIRDWKFKEKALACFGRGYGPVVRETVC